MEQLLRLDFTAHYGIPRCSAPNIGQQTQERYFEIDDVNNELILHTTTGYGIANFSNPDIMSISIVNYDKFLTSTPADFNNGMKRCDMIIVCDSGKYFILGELKNRGISNRNRRRDVRNDAKDQLFHSLSRLISVPIISHFLNTKTVKKCCYFNKQSNAPIGINAVTAFNRLPNTFSAGFKMEFKLVEDLGFEFWEYTGDQTLILNR